MASLLINFIPIIEADHFLSVVLPSTRGEALESAIPPAEVTKVALRLKYQVERVIPCELEESQVTRANSPVITRKVIETAKDAAGEQYKGCVVYCLLVCRRWFKRQALLELWDADLHELRAVACEVLAKQMYLSLTHLPHRCWRSNMSFSRSSPSIKLIAVSLRANSSRCL